MATVTATNPRIEITASGGQTQFTWNFLVLDAQDLQVLHIPLATGTPVTLTQGVDYTIDGGSLENEAGGTITLDPTQFPTGATAGDIIVIIRDTIITRDATYTTGGFFPAETVEREYTDIYLIMQENQREISRALFLPDGLAGAVSSWQAPIPEDGKAWVWDGTDGTLRNSAFILDDLLSTVAALQPTVQTFFFQVVTVTNADSPIVPTAGFDGTLYRVDTSGGDVIFNLDTLANYNKDIKFSFVKTTGDANKITVNRGGTDTFDAGVTFLDFTVQNVMSDIVGQLSSGVWQSRTFSGGAGAVTSVFGRAGAVVAVAGDYAASQITNDSGVAGATVDTALDNAAASGPVSSVFGRTGVVGAVSGDYNSTQITNSSAVAGATVTAALNTLNGSLSAFATQLLHVQDQKTSGTQGGSFAGGAPYKTRDLNTVLTNEIGGASLGSNQITLPAGTYYIEATAPGRRVDTHKAKLRNITDGADTLIGTAENAGNVAGASNSKIQSVSFIFGRFTIGASKTFEVQHRCLTTQNTNGFGASSGYGEIEIYTDVRIWKVG